MVKLDNEWKDGFNEVCGGEVSSVCQFALPSMLCLPCMLLKLYV